MKNYNSILGHLPGAEHATHLYAPSFWRFTVRPRRESGLGVVCGCDLRESWAAGARAEDRKNGENGEIKRRQGRREGSGGVEDAHSEFSVCRRWSILSTTQVRPKRETFPRGVSISQRPPPSLEGCSTAHSGQSSRRQRKESPSQQGQHLAQTHHSCCR